MEIFKYKYDEPFNPVLQALHLLGGSGTNDEIEEKMVEVLSLSNEEVEDIHRGNTTKLSYRSAWARNYLKRLGLIENSSRAVWVLTPEGRKTKEIDREQSKKIVKSLSGVKKQPTKDEPSIEAVSEELSELSWSDELIELIKKAVSERF